MTRMRFIVTTVTPPRLETWSKVDWEVEQGEQKQKQQQQSQLAPHFRSPFACAIHFVRLNKADSSILGLRRRRQSLLPIDSTSRIQMSAQLQVGTHRSKCGCARTETRRLSAKRSVFAISTREKKLLAIRSTTPSRLVALKSCPSHPLKRRYVIAAAALVKLCHRADSTVSRDKRYSVDIFSFFDSINHPDIPRLSVF
jgi:hypothetical protein